jgi:hypothetical protein
MPCPPLHCAAAIVLALLLVAHGPDARSQTQAPERGGNAVDAAIAAQLVLNVVAREGVAHGD